MLVDGMLFAPLATEEELDGVPTASSTPLILLGEHRFDGRFDHVAVDNVRAAYDATTHLIEAGRTRIAAIGAQPKLGYTTPLQRAAGFTRALEAADARPLKDRILTAARYSRNDGYTAARELLSRSPRPDAVFCFTDLLAIGAMRAAFDAGLSVPEDLAVIGIDDIEEGRFSRPSLSTVSLDTPFIAEEAVERIVARIEHPDAEAREIIAPHALLPRESTTA